MAMAHIPNASPFLKKFPMQLDKRQSSSLMQPPQQSGSKILPMIHPRSNSNNNNNSNSRYIRPTSPSPKFPAIGAPPYVPVRHQYRMAPPITKRTAVPCFSAPPLPGPAWHCFQPMMGHQPSRMASPVRIRQAIHVFAAPPKVVVRSVQQQQQPKVVIPAAVSEVKEEAIVGVKKEVVQLKEEDGNFFTTIYKYSTVTPGRA